MHRFFVFALICFIALCAGVYISFPYKEISIGAFSWPQQEVVSVPIVKTNIRFVGDVMLARNVEYIMDTYGVDYPVSMLPKLPENSYLVGNFEASIPVEHAPTKSMGFSFSVRPPHLEGLKKYGFTHFSLANNHAYDFGVDDFQHTEAVLSGSSFAPFGEPRVLATSSVMLIDVGTSTVAVIGVYAVDVPPPLSEVVSVFKYASSVSDVQIAFVHWGDEYKPTHNGSQERLAHAFVDAGADIVIGHHPHVTQDIELYKKSLIFYSIGNFIFDQYFSDEVQEGLMLDLRLAERKIDILPVSSLGSKTAPRLAPSLEKNEMLDELAKKSSEGLGEMIKTGSLILGF
jgi:gamma-polyglutamate biosynthesis protein CapA